MRRLCKWRIAISGLLLAAAFGISTSVAEEVIIEEKSSIGNILIGDYSCSLCPSSLVTASLEMRADAQQYGTIELTAGELWLFFDSKIIFVEATEGLKNFPLAKHKTASRPTANRLPTDFDSVEHCPLKDGQLFRRSDLYRSASASESFGELIQCGG